MQCISPVYIPRKTGDVISCTRIAVPCNKCAACLSNKRQMWSFRIQQELKVSTTALFLTMTYSDEKMNYSSDENGTLNKRDIQLFLKKLRKKINYESTKIGKVPKTIKYFICGEYGEHTNRPHYHGIIFNIPAYMDGQKTLLQCWDNGFIMLGTVTPQSISYSAKYCINEISNFNEREKTFAMVSKGMGISYVGRLKDWHNRNNVFYAHADGGKKVALNRYYREKIFDKKRIYANNIKVKKELEEAKDKLRSQQIEQGYNPGQVELDTKQTIINRVNKSVKKSKL